jgi:hypothetical protein
VVKDSGDAAAIADAIAHDLLRGMSSLARDAAGLQAVELLLV